MKKHAHSISGVLLSAGLTLFLASCLNPVDFDSSTLPAIKVNVTGEIDTRSTDYAILWVINRTNSVDVGSLTVTRADNPEGYPKVAAKPAHGSTFASYHPPSDLPYTIKIDYKPADPPSSAYTAEQCTGSFTIPEKYMPKAGASYPIYLYRAQDGGLILIEEEMMTKVPDSADTGNPPLPPSMSAPAYPLIMKNITADMNAEFVDFTFNGSTLSFEGPGAKDETLTYLEAAQYQVQAGLYRPSAGPPSTVWTGKKNVSVITPNDSQSWHTLYLWIYKTRTGGYSTTTVWPPNPNDAADVSVADIAGDGNGLLKIVNKSESGSVLRKIRIDANETEFGNSYNPSFTKDMEWTRVLPPGVHTVEFMPSGQSFYGTTLTVRIKEGEETTLSYYDQLARLDLPADNGYGSGLIKVVNNSTAVVERVVVKDTDDGKLSYYPWNRFNPPSPINYSDTGYISVVGYDNFPVTEGSHYLIMVELKLSDGSIALIERPAALKDKIVEIIISDQAVQGVPKSTVTVVNQTGNLTYPVKIVAVTLFNAAKPAESSQFGGGAWTPAGSITAGNHASFKVNHSIAMPITSADSFKAKVTLESANGETGTIEKAVGSLYNVNQTITITAADLPPSLIGNSAADITRFVLAGREGSIIGTTISVKVPYGTVLTSLAPTTINVSPGATVSPASGVAQNFTSPVTYTVTAENGKKKVYTVKVTVEKNTAALITGFNISGQTGSATISSNTISLTMPYGTSLGSLTPTISVSPGATVSPASGTPRNFNSSQTYTVTAEDGITTRNYTVTVNTEPYSGGGGGGGGGGVTHYFSAYTNTYYYSPSKPLVSGLNTFIVNCPASATQSNPNYAKLHYYGPGSPTGTGEWYTFPVTITVDYDGKTYECLIKLSNH